MKAIVFALAACAIHAAAAAAPVVSGPGACGPRAIDNESFLTCVDGEPVMPRAAADAADAQLFRPLPMGAQQAHRLKADISGKSLLVDIRSRAEVVFGGMPEGFDVHVPYMEQAGDFRWNSQSRQVEMEFNADFLRDLDRALAGAGMNYSQPVVLLCRSGERSRMAAELLTEHGYEQVFVVRDGFDGPLAPRPDGLPTHDGPGWKNAGLPWVAEIDPRWLYRAQR